MEGGGWKRVRFVAMYSCHKEGGVLSSYLKYVGHIYCLLQTFPLQCSPITFILYVSLINLKVMNSLILRLSRFLH